MPGPARCPHRGCGEFTHSRAGERFGLNYGMICECRNGHISVDVPSAHKTPVPIPEGYSNIFTAYEEALENPPPKPRKIVWNPSTH
jgi:hypothetical protein